MKVICKKPTKRLVKNIQYEVVNLWNDGTNQRWLEGKLEIKGIGRFVVTNFTDTCGMPLPKINISSNVSRARPERIGFSDLKVGDILVCESDQYKSMLIGGLYRIESIREVQERYYHSGYVKFEGIKRSLKFNAWRFRKLTTEESREMSLGSLLSGEEPNIIKSQKIKKIDMIGQKESFLIEVLAKSIMDRNRHHLSVVEWACEKIGDKMGLVKEDFDSIMNMPLKEILGIIDRK